MSRIVSTANDYAVEYVDGFGNRVQVMVCKYQEDDYRVRSSTEFGRDSGNWMGHVLDHLTAPTYSQAVANANAHVDWAEARARDFRKLD